MPHYAATLVEKKYIHIETKLKEDDEGIANTAWSNDQYLVYILHIYYYYLLYNVLYIIYVI